MRTNFLSLPIELRLQIAEYAFEQPPNAGLSYHSHYPIKWDPSYSSAHSLSLILVCRQFRDDFTSIAYQKTRFLLGINADQIVDNLSDEFLKNIRKLAVSIELHLIVDWEETGLLFGRDCIHLDELCLSSPMPGLEYLLVKMLRRLRNVKTIRFILPHDVAEESRLTTNRLIGAMWKENHYQRYDAPEAPNLESVWWKYELDEQDRSVRLVAQEAKPAMEEEDYMLLMAPLVQRLMSEMAS